MLYSSHLSPPSPSAPFSRHPFPWLRPAFPPRWALGWGQSRWGYASVAALEEVVARYDALMIPLDVIYSDVDHMDGFRDFTYDPVNYPLPAVRKFVAALGAAGRRWVPILDPGIRVDPGYSAYDAGMQEGVFVKRAPTAHHRSPRSGRARRSPPTFSPRARGASSRRRSRLFMSSRPSPGSGST